MKFTVVTILPELVEPALAAGVVGWARDAGTIANAREAIFIYVINGLLWGIVYGGFGYLIDCWRRLRGRSTVN